MKASSEMFRCKETILFRDDFSSDEDSMMKSENEK